MKTLSTAIHALAGALILGVCFPAVLMVLDRSFGLTTAIVDPGMLRRAAEALVVLGLVTGIFLGRVSSMKEPAKLVVIASVVAASVGAAHGVWIWIVSADFVFQPWTALVTYGLTALVVLRRQLLEAKRQSRARADELLKQLLQY